MADQSPAPVSGSPAGEAGAVRPDEITAVPVRHPLRWLAAAGVIYVIVALGYSFATNPRFEWDVVWKYLFSEQLIRGALTTLLLTALAMVIGVLLGIVIAVMRRSENPLLSGSAWVYIWIFRGTPVLVQIIFFNSIAALYRDITLAVPFGGPELTDLDANDLITPFVAGLLALALNEAAYMAEIVRGGLLSVDEGQTEAAEALGMTRSQTLRRIVLPQAMRVIIPPTGNETISMLKLTSLVSVIGSTELLYAGQKIYSTNYKVIQLLIAVSLWYLLITSIMQIGQYYIERRYARGTRRDHDEGGGLLRSLAGGVLGWKRGTVEPTGGQA